MSLVVALLERESSATRAGHAAGVRLIQEKVVRAPPIVRYGVLSKGFTNRFLKSTASEPYDVWVWP